MTPLGWVFNLAAELELAARGYCPPHRLIAQLAAHGQGALALMGPDDVVLSAYGQATAAPPVTTALLGRAWCPTPQAIALLQAANVQPEPHPPFAVTRRVNHRRFAHELGAGLPEQRFVEDAATLETLLEGLLEGRAWMLKRPLAFAGRGQLRLPAGTVPDAKQRAWIAASLQRDGLIVEPLVTPSLEVSVHGFVWRDGHAELGRVCVQGVSARGVYHSAALAAPDALSADERSRLMQAASDAASALAAAGYFGPFGVDAYRHGDGFCALSEINARYTMAFAVGFERPAHTLRL